MKYFLIIFSLILYNSEASSWNIFEKTAILLAVPIVIDQYFDNSLNEESDLDKKFNVLSKHYDKNYEKNYYVNIKKRSDLLLYLEATEVLNNYGN